MRSPEWDALQSELAAAGVRAGDQLGRFVDNVAFFGASSFDERAAMPVLIAALPRLTDHALIGAVAGHLRRPWARPAAYRALHDAFRRWAAIENGPGWHLGDALVASATAHNAGELVELCEDPTYGRSRQMIVYSLWRFKKTGPDVENAVRRLINDPEVGLHAMASLRRLVGADAALRAIEEVERTASDLTLKQQATREIKKLRKRLSTEESRPV